MVATLQSIGMHQPEFLIEDHPSTTLFAEVLIPIFGFHVLSGKDALIEIEIDTVLAQNLGKNLALDLFNELINGISENEISLESWMSVKIKIHE